MSKVSLDRLEVFSFQMNVLLCFLQTDLLLHSAIQYGQCIAGQGPLVDYHVIFLDSNNVFISRPGRPASDQNASYSGPKRAHSLVYLTIPTRDGLIMYIYRPEEMRRHDWRKIHFD